MKEEQGAERVDRDAYEREQERIRRERESIAEMAGEGDQVPRQKETCKQE